MVAAESQDLVTRAQQWARELPQEKVYLHLDNTGYFKGETIWFKAYITRSDTERRGNLSSVLYVELLSPNGDIISKKKLYIKGGIGAGSITLDNAVMPTGFYEIRAYTRYMTNWGTNACYSRVIPIFQEPRVVGQYTPVLSKESSLLEPAIQDESKLFYPEGGYIVRGVPNRVAYSIHGERGVVDIPATQTSRSVELTIGGKTKTYKLPEFKNEGIAMRVDAISQDDILVDLWATPAMQGQALGYVLMNNGKVQYSGDITATEHQQITIPAEKVRDGVSQVTLFTTEGNIISERFIFRCPREEKTLRVRNMTKTLLPCGKVVMDIQADPYTSLSFSAMDAKTMANGQYGSIKTWMLLGSEVKGYIAHPEYYFESDDQEHRKAADLLMMVQGWRRYDWELMVGNKQFQNPQIIEEGLCFFGSVIPKKKRKQPLDGVKVTATLIGPDERFAVVSVTDTTGFYSMRLPDFMGTYIMNINTSIDGTKSEYRIPIERHFAPSPRPVSDEELTQFPLDTTHIFHWDIPEKDEYAWKKFLVKNGTVMQEVAVKGTQQNHYNWSAYTDESLAEKKAVLYYNCEEEAEAIADEGEDVPGLVTWLKAKNPIFSGNEPTDKLLWCTRDYRDLSDLGKSILNYYNTSTGTLSELEMESRTIRRNVVPAYEVSSNFQDATYYDTDAPTGWMYLWGDGLMIKNRPVVWIVNNHFATVTNFNRFKLDTNGMQEDVTDNRGRIVDMPVSLDEVKSLYVTDDLTSIRDHIRTSDLATINPMVVFCYTYRNKIVNKIKGTRYTHFQGYDPVEVFETEDYSDIPPVDDFRRTLFWEPNLWTDEDGHAQVEFWNNSTCTDMIISAEGITMDGKFVVGE